MQNNEKYFYINDVGTIVSVTWNNADDDLKRKEIGNAYKTFEEANKEILFRKIEKELKDFATQNNAQIDWNTNDSKYFLYYKHNIQKVCIAFWSFDFYGTPVFSSREIAKLAIETIGEERLIKEYFKIDKEKTT